MSLRQSSGPFVEIWIGDYFLAEGRLDSFAGGCTTVPSNCDIFIFMAIFRMYESIDKYLSLITHLVSFIPTPGFIKSSKSTKSSKINFHTPLHVPNVIKMPLMT
jgi:hypothetical protein